MSNAPTAAKPTKVRTAATTGATSSSQDPDGVAVTPSKPLPGMLRRFVVAGAASHYRDEVVVWTPPGYDLSRDRRPVLFALHGWPGQPRMLYENLQLVTSVMTEVAAGKVAAPVIVMPRWGRIDTECTNSDAAHHVETWLTSDLPAWVQTHFRTLSGPSAWATYGYSAGAYCATMLAMRHPRLFGAAIMLSGYDAPEFAPSPSPFPAGSPLAKSYDMTLLARLHPPAVRVYVVTDPADHQASTPSLQLARAARAPLAVTFVTAPGGHRVSLWIPQTRLALAWLARQLPGFRPT